MPKDLFIIDTRCHLNKSIEKAFAAKGYEVEVRRNLIAITTMLKLWYRRMFTTNRHASYVVNIEC